MNWQEYYRSRTRSPDEVAAMVKPGMRVDFPFAAGAVMQRALAARGKQLDGVIDLRMASPLIDPGWLAGDVASRFRIEFELFIGNMGRPLHDRHGQPTCRIYFRPDSSRMTNGRAKTGR